ncbi:4617_t:CDS:2 [Acaulospora colombiana]|uniref:4617_t:CDS:1 n=1 Tax=Acaulospora colombiana TaxID=27376 RepID=A0ACA9NN32_9GLOM|nr:4617_t:CDS:2 [Acaulospora colombiana]
MLGKAVQCPKVNKSSPSPSSPPASSSTTVVRLDLDPLHFGCGLFLVTMNTAPIYSAWNDITHHKALDCPYLESSQPVLDDDMEPAICLGPNSNNSLSRDRDVSETHFQVLHSLCFFAQAPEKSPLANLGVSAHYGKFSPYMSSLSDTYLDEMSNTPSLSWGLVRSSISTGVANPNCNCLASTKVYTSKDLLRRHCIPLAKRTNIARHKRSCAAAAVGINS